MKLVLGVNVARKCLLGFISAFTMHGGSQTAETKQKMAGEKLGLVFSKWKVGHV